jgi:hypothetical protein
MKQNNFYQVALSQSLFLLLFACNISNNSDNNTTMSDDKESNVKEKFAIEKTTIPTNVAICENNPAG